VTEELTIPTIGIGAGNGCSGQVLVQTDMMGQRPPDSFMPKFVKRYGQDWEHGLAAVTQYRDEVVSRQYPGTEYSYKVDAVVAAAFKKAAHETKPLVSNRTVSGGSPSRMTAEVPEPHSSGQRTSSCP
jgi:3-methyl-2-oxobutanoate hydroxymethyltransferase